MALRANANALWIDSTGKPTTYFYRLIEALITQAFGATGSTVITYEDVVKLLAAQRPDARIDQLTSRIDALEKLSGARVSLSKIKQDIEALQAQLALIPAVNIDPLKQDIEAVKKQLAQLQTINLSPVIQRLNDLESLTASIF